MKLKKPENSNYCATVVEIKQIVSLENCDNIQHAIILGNKVIVGKDVNIGDIGLFFPVETQLSKKYLSVNNLYSKSELNSDKNKKGYFGENGRIRCVKLRGNMSEGLFMPLNSIYPLFGHHVDEMSFNLQINDEFDELDGIKICNKYVIPKKTQSQGLGKSKKGKQPKKVSKIIENQFRFHIDTSMLYKNLHMFHPDDLISISYKLHGTSGISSKLLCKKKLNWKEKILKKLGVNIVDSQYDYLYSSRKVIKNEELNKGVGYYGEDIWGLADKQLRDFLQDGMTFYYEIVGYLPSGGMIQKDYDYGCKAGEYKIYIYRITYTNDVGKVFEFSAKQVQDFCKENGLNAVPQLFYGYAKDICNKIVGIDALLWRGEQEEFEIWRNTFLNTIKDLYNEKDCFMCKNKLPEEGCVIRIESNDLKVYKQKSERFYLRETKLLDKGESDIESEN